MADLLQASIFSGIEHVQTEMMRAMRYRVAGPRADTQAEIAASDKPASDGSDPEER